MLKTRRPRRTVASLLFWREWTKLKRQGVDVRARFAALPPE